MTRKDIQNNPKIANSIIYSWLNSESYKQMIVSDKYYNGNNDIKFRKRDINLPNEYFKYDSSKTKHYENLLEFESIRANHKLVHNYHYELVNQATSYLCGKPIKLSYDFNCQESFIPNKIEKILKDNNWLIFAQENVKNAQKYKLSWFKIWIDINGNFKFDVVNTKECVPIFDESSKLQLMLRHFVRKEFEKNGEIAIKKYLEVYDNNSKDLYNFSSMKPIKLDIPLIYKNINFSNGFDRSFKKILSWNDVPFVMWKFNSDNIDSLSPIKCFIDILDLDLSDLANNIDDIDMAIWILENYQGQSIEEFLRDLKIYKAINVAEGGSVKSEKSEIPLDARKYLYEICNNNIYKFGRGLDFTDRENRGNQSGIGLRWSFSALDKKVDEIENHGKNALFQLLKFMLYYFSFSKKINENLVYKINFIFNRSMMVNEEEQSKIISDSTGILSKETLIEHHPLVENPTNELERIKTERERNIAESS